MIAIPRDVLYLLEKSFKTGYERGFEDAFEVHDLEYNKEDLEEAWKDFLRKYIS